MPSTRPSRRKSATSSSDTTAESPSGKPPARSRVKSNNAPANQSEASKEASADADAATRNETPLAPAERKALHRELYYSMLLQRRFEERTAEMYAIGRIGGFCHLYIGQEAVSTGFLSLLREDDYVITTYRDHGHALARGLPPNGIMAELFGRIDGVARGKGGSMHLFDASRGFLGGHGIVGGHIPIAAGVGFAIKYRGGDQVIVCFMGEAAVNNGAFHEALNMASLWKLPCLFVIENNRYGMGTAVERASSINDIYKRGAAYGMPRDVVDGQDVFAVRAAARTAIDRARSESIPTLLEVRTYRFMGHSMSDAVSGTYRTKEELEKYLKRDPVALLRARIEDDGDMTEEEFDVMDTEIKATVQEAIDFAENSPEPPLEALYEDVLVETTSD